MNETEQPIVIFDLGGVLVDFAGFGELSRYMPQPEPAAALRDRWIRDPSVAALERGQIGEQQFATAFARDWQLNLEPAELVELFSAWFRGLYPGAEELLVRLRRDSPGVRLGCLTNSNICHWKKFEVTAKRLFDFNLLSFELGSVKPDPELFAEVLATLGCRAEEVLFFDDTPVNVESAKSHGFEAECVQGLAELERSLIRRGLVLETALSG